MGLILYGLKKPWTYYNNEITNRFNLIRKYREREPADEYHTSYVSTSDDLIELRGANINLSNFENGYISIPQVMYNKTPIYGICVKDSTTRFHYFYFIKEQTRITGGYLEFRISLNYFATYGELVLYPDRDNNNTTQSPLCKNNLKLDKYSTFSEYIFNPSAIARTKVYDWKLFQANIDEIKDDIDLENNATEVRVSNDNILGSTAGYHNTKKIVSNPLVTQMSGFDIAYNTDPSFSRNGNSILLYSRFWGTYELNMTWMSTTIIADTPPSDVIDKIVNSTEGFLNASDTDKFIVLNVTAEWWYQKRHGQNVEFKSIGIGDKQSQIIAIPLSYSPESDATNNSNRGSFIYNWLNSMIGNGQLTTENVLGVFRFKSNSFLKNGVKSLAFFEPKDLGFSSRNNEWMDKYFIIGWVLGSSLDIIRPNIPTRYLEYGWVYYIKILLQLPYSSFEKANNPAYYNDWAIMTDNIFRFIGAYTLNLTNDDKIVTYDWARIAKNPSQPLIVYSPFGYESLWVDSLGNDTFGSGNFNANSADFWTSTSMMPWKFNDNNFKQQQTTLNYYTNASSTSAKFWASQKNSWETSMNQAKFNIGTNVVGTIGAGIGGAVSGGAIGSSVPVIGTVAGAVIGGISGIAGGASSLTNSVQNFQRLKAQESDLARQSGGSISQGNSNWIWSRYVQAMEISWNYPTRETLYNRLVERGFNVYMPASNSTVWWNNARYIFNNTVVSNYKILTLRVHKDSTSNLINNLRIYFAKEVKVPVGDNIIIWLVNLFTNTFNLYFDVPNPRTRINKITTKTEQLYGKIYDQNRTSNTATPKEKQGDDA